MNFIKKLSLVLPVFSLLAFSSTADAQENITVKGVVSATTGESVIGAGVMIKGTMTGVTTDIDGQYEIEAPDNAVLVISSIGYKTLEIAINGRTKVDVILEPDNKLLEEAVAIGYGSQSKLTLTGSVAQTSGESLAKSSTVNLSQGLSICRRALQEGFPA